MSHDLMNYVLFGSITIGMILRVVLIFLICLIVIRILRALTGKMLKRTKLNGAVQSFLGSAIRVALWLIAIIIIADSLGIPTTSLIAVVSVAGLALSLSIQNILSNLFSGLTLLFTKPFEAGNFVEIGDKSGTIKSISLFYTILETPDKVVISMPNSDVTSSSIKNFSISEQRRVDMDFGVSYDSSVDDTKSAILQAVVHDARILVDPAPFVAIKSYGESSVTYVLRVWCNAADYWDVHFALNENVRESFAKNGIKMTYNHLNVHLVAPEEAEKSA